MFWFYEFMWLLCVIPFNTECPPTIGFDTTIANTICLIRNWRAYYSKNTVKTPNKKLQKQSTETKGAGVVSDS